MKRGKWWEETTRSSGEGFNLISGEKETRKKTCGSKRENRKEGKTYYRLKIDEERKLVKEKGKESRR